MPPFIPGTFLELVQRLHFECDVAGNSPTTLDGASAETVRLASWIAQGWVSIQATHTDWTFQRRTTSWETVAGKARYSLDDCNIPTGTFGRWFPRTLRSYPTEAGTRSEIFMSIMPFDTWRNIYHYGTTRDTRSHPTVAAVAPDKGIALGPVPNDGYTVYGDYYRAAEILEEDDDEPSIPIEHRMVIVYKAMESYGRFEAAPEVAEAGMRMHRVDMSKLTVEYLPRVFIGSPIA